MQKKKKKGNTGARVQEKGNENETLPRLFRVTHFSLVPVVKKIPRTCYITLYLMYIFKAKNWGNYFKTKRFRRKNVENSLFYNSFSSLIFYLFQRKLYQLDTCLHRFIS